MNTNSELCANSPAMSGGTLPFSASAVSWGAIIAGAAAAAALSLILLILGMGFGFSSVSPWAYDGISAAQFGISTIMWVTLTQLVASGMGGYLAGRLRTKWLDTHTDEVYFRDTAHGFLTWAVASLATAALLTSVIGSIIGGGIKAGASVTGSAATTAMATAAMASSDRTKAGSETGALNYFVGSLFQPNMPATDSVEKPNTSALIEVTTIFLNAGQTEAMPAEDVRYVGQLVAQRTGLTRQEAEQRVTDTYARMQEKLKAAEVAVKEAADKARKASAYAALWLFISLLAGAFVASVSAIFGGRQRDLC